MPKPRYTRPGDPSNRASDRNDLVRELDRLDRRITEGQLWQHPQGGGVAVLKLQIKSGTAAGKYRITDGTVNTQTPTLGGTAINATTPPEFTVTATTYVWIKVVGVFAAPDTYTITIETSATSATPSGTAILTTGYTTFFSLGKVTLTSGVYAISNYHGGVNLGVESFGNINLWRGI